MKRILFLIMCISLASACFAGTDVPDKNAQLPQTTLTGGMNGKAANEEPIFKADPDAKMKLDQIHIFKLEPDNETAIKHSIARMSMEKGYTNQSEHFISNVAVVFTENMPVPIIQGLILVVVRIDDEKVMLGTPIFHRSYSFADLDQSDAELRKALEKMRNSKLPNPAIYVIVPGALDDEQFNTKFSQTMRNIVSGLKEAKVQINSDEIYFLCPPPFPKYLIGYAESVQMREFFKGFQKSDFAGLASMVVWGKENASRDYYGPDGKLKYFFFHARNSAPVELSLNELESISSTQTALNNDIYTVTVIMKNGVKVAFGGLSAVNPDFLKSEQDLWKTVVGLSSANGFTISVAYKDGNKLVSVSGDAIRKNTLNIQDKLPKSLVRMFKMGIPGVDFLSDTDAKVRVAGAVSLGEIKDPCAVGALAVLLKDSDAAVRTAAGKRTGPNQGPYHG